LSYSYLQVIILFPRNIMIYFEIGVFLLLFRFISHLSHTVEIVLNLIIHKSIHSPVYLVSHVGWYSYVSIFKGT